MGDAVREAFDPARRRLGLTGTPFRSDTNPIPFITYIDEPGGGKRSSPDYVYGYGRLEDTVVRPVIFLAYSGEMRWRTRAGDEIAATLGTPMTKDQIAQAWRTALDPAGEWVSRVLEAADKRLTEVRRGMPDAGGLVIAADHADARAYAACCGPHRQAAGRRALRRPVGEPKITAFSASDDRWMVAVRMVSEGVDIPGSPSACTRPASRPPLFFAQAIGRFVRHASGGRPRRCSCPRCRSCSGSPPNLRQPATTCSAGPRASLPRGRSWPRRCGAGQSRHPLANPPSGAERVRALRPGAL